MPASPNQVAAAATEGGTCFNQLVPTAIKAPRASSQARVSGEK